MKTPLDTLLESLDPAHTIVETENRANQALNSFPPPQGKIDTWDTFRFCMIRFVCHAETAILRLKQPLTFDMEFLWGRACRYLIKTYGENGEKAAYEMARTGKEGGLYAVLKKLILQLADEYSDNEITARIGVFWDRLSPKEWLAAADEFLAKYGHLLPPELTEGSAARVKENLPAYLKEYPKLVHRLRQVGR